MIDNIEVKDDGSIEIEGETDAGNTYNVGYWATIEPDKAEEVALDVLRKRHPGRYYFILQAIDPKFVEDGAF